MYNLLIVKVVFRFCVKRSVDIGLVIFTKLILSCLLLKKNGVVILQLKFIREKKIEKLRFEWNKVLNKMMLGTFK